MFAKGSTAMDVLAGAADRDIPRGTGRRRRWPGQRLQRHREIPCRFEPIGRPLFQTPAHDVNQRARHRRVDPIERRRLFQDRVHRFDDGRFLERS